VCAGFSGELSVHLLLVHVLPHDAGKEAMLHYLLGILGAPTKPAGRRQAQGSVMPRCPLQGDRAIGTTPARCGFLPALCLHAAQEAVRDCPVEGGSTAQQATWGGHKRLEPVAAVLTSV
jgi:hypothetical protein